MEDIRKIFAFGLEIWGKLNGVYQEDIANLINRDQTTISNYYTGKTRISKKNIELITDHYNLNYEEILKAGRKAYRQKKQTNEPEKNQDELIEITTKRHKQVIEKFRQKDLALKLNEVLLEIESINPESLKSALEALDLVKIKAEREAEKKRTANGDE